MKLANLLLVSVVTLLNLFTVRAQEVDSVLNLSLPDSMFSQTDSLNKITPDSNSYISNDAISSEINYKANDSFPIFFENDLMILYKEAEVTYEQIQLNAGIIKFDWKNNTVFAEGYYDSLGVYQEAPVFKDGDQEYKARQIHYNFKTKKAKIYELFTNEGENYVHGEEVKKDAQNNLYIKNAKFTSCNHEHPHFYIASPKIKILKNKIVTGPAWLTIEDIPVPLAVPFGFFPKQDKRSSGIVLPAYGESTDRGFYLKGLGYYLGLNDYFDILLQGDIYSRGSWMASVSSNYAVRYKYRGNLKIQYGNNKFGDPETTDYRVDKDFSINWSHTQDTKARPNSSFSASVNAGSSNSFRNNSTNASEIVQNTLSSSVSYSKKFVGTPFSMTSSLAHSQNLSSHLLNLSAPQMSLNMKRVFPFRGHKAVKTDHWYDDIGLTYSLNFKNSLSTTDSMFLKRETWQEWQNGIKHSIPLSTSFKVLKYFTLSPQINYTGRTYFERTMQSYYSNYAGAESDTVIEEVEKGVYHIHDFGASATINTRFYGTFDKERIEFLKLLRVEAIRHTVSPSMSLSWNPDLSDPKYGIYKEVQVDSLGTTEFYSPYAGMIYGVPGSGKRGLISFSIANNLEAKVLDDKDTTGEGTKKIKLLESLNISGTYNVFKDSMKLSTLSFNGRTTLFNRKFNISFSGYINPYYLTPDSHFVDKMAILERQALGKLTNANISLNTSLNSPKNKKTNANEEQIGYSYLPYNNYVDWDVPWNISIGYSLVYKNYYTNSNSLVVNDPVITQTVNFSGNVNLTEKWKINFRSGYDLEQKKLSYTSFDLYRDLHCWEMSFSWIPFGYRQSYVFKINVKSSTLQDLKIDKKKQYYDF